jgi:hypothetical protein
MCSPGSFSVWPSHSVKGLSLRSLAIMLALDLSPEVLEGNLRYHSGSWQLGNVDLGKYLNRYRNHRLVAEAG